jgi:hypothetical protein
MYLWVETLVLLLITYGIGLLVAWFVWGRRSGLAKN